MLEPPAFGAAAQQELTTGDAVPEELVVRVENRWNHYWHVVPLPAAVSEPGTSL